MTYASTYRVQLSYATFGLDVDENGVVIDVAPIGWWMRGKHISTVGRWVDRKGGEMLNLGRIE